ncbi:pentapeptide repeat-containing protein [Streptomyces specialis]|uniref:pentapeptide repeat-containing protein n=1 Tax=Streptomyces specialis TaxID=498367 RepID=UPI00099E8187|nr:pentapeptide repeat-containing protein [Streptomyces specialis]
MTTPHPDPGPVPEPPSWPHCAHGADPAGDPVGCRGIRVAPYNACLAHLDHTDRDAYLADLTPGADIDHRGTVLTRDLLEQLHTALRDPGTSKPRYGDALFHHVTFTDSAWFNGATFTGSARFNGATFSDAWFVGATFNRSAGFEGASFNRNAGFEGATFTGSAWFNGTTFTGDTWFGGAAFTGDTWFGGAAFTGSARFGGATFSDAWFVDATFTGDAWFVGAAFTGSGRFGGATFTSDAWFGGASFNRDALFDHGTFTGSGRFEGATFTGSARFNGATFTGSARFDSATFTGDAWFEGATFTGSRSRFSSAVIAGSASFTEARVGVDRLGPLVCGGVVRLDGAVFPEAVTLEIVAAEVSCIRTRWESTATLRLLHARLDLSDAVLTMPVAAVTHTDPARFSRLENPDGAVARAVAGVLRRQTKVVKVVSLRGVDAAMLVLTGTDLTDCVFSGAFHLDQLRIEGRTRFAGPPAGWHRRGLWPVRWTRRRVLAEEHHWRAVAAGQPEVSPGGEQSSRLWRTGTVHGVPGRAPVPEGVAAAYRQLRKALEDGKNEPGAADFFYGEMEMRRHDREGTPWAERALLGVYWAVSGYGLRASRALAWLAAAMTATVLVMMLAGLPADSPKPTTTGKQVEAGREVTLVTDTPDPVNPHGPLRERLSGERFEPALRVVVNSVVFRSSGQDLTTAGTYTEMAARVTEPVLLALAVLAVRGRIKR